MSIQNINNLGQASQPVRLGPNGRPDAVVAPSTGAGQPNFTVELPQVAVKQAAGQQPPPDQLRIAVENINKALKQANNNLEFHVDASTKITVVKLVDTESGDVIRQFPSEETLQIARSIDQIQQGLLLRQKA